jgi:hypothetical protein
VRGLVGHQTWGLRGFLPRHGRERQARSGRPLPRCSDPLVMGLFGGEGHARRALRGRRIGGTAVSGEAEVELWKTPSRKTWARQPACQRPNFGPTVFGKSSDFDLYTSKRIRIRQVRTKWKKENLKRQSQSKKSLHLRPRDSLGPVVRGIKPVGVHERDLQRRCSSVTVLVWGHRRKRAQQRGAHRRVNVTRGQMV